MMHSRFSIFVLVLVSTAMNVRAVPLEQCSQTLVQRFDPYASALFDFWYE
jgi:hypothetical protein